MQPVDAAGLGAAAAERRSLRRTVLVTVSVTAAMAVAGAPLGLLWSWLAPTVPVINAGQNGIVVNDPSPEEYIAADGWFTLLGFGFGLLAAVLRLAGAAPRPGPGPAARGDPRRRSAGSLVGRGRSAGWSGSSAYERLAARRRAPRGRPIGRPPDLHAHGALLVPAFAAVIVLTLLAGWSNDPDLDRRPAPSRATARRTCSGRRPSRVSRPADLTGGAQFGLAGRARSDSGTGTARTRPADPPRG